jgi:hypothetical protein
MNQPQDLATLLTTLSEDQQEALFNKLRQKFRIHPLEQQWNISAEFVLEAISRSQDITKRGVRGIIAELAFSTHILTPIKNEWKEEIITGDQPYDAKISKVIDGKTVEILIQTKNQRVEKGQPLRPTKTAIKQDSFLEDWFIAETQKTRTGKKKKSTTNEEGVVEVEEVDTRPYRFGEFHILSVCMQPSTNEWTDFMFTPSSTLLPSKKSNDLVATLQPVPPAKTKAYNWTPDLLECIDWILHPEKMPAPFIPTPKPVKKK